MEDVSATEVFVLGSLVILSLMIVALSFFCLFFWPELCRSIRAAFDRATGRAKAEANAYDHAEWERRVRAIRNDELRQIQRLQSQSTIARARANQTVNNALLDEFRIAIAPEMPPQYRICLRLNGVTPARFHAQMVSVDRDLDVFGYSADTHSFKPITGASFPTSPLETTEGGILFDKSATYPRVDNARRIVVGQVPRNRHFGVWFKLPCGLVAQGEEDSITFEDSSGRRLTVDVRPGTATDAT